LGFRHGIDWDHIAALTDLTASRDRVRQSMALATMYAVGHALVVFALGVATIRVVCRDTTLAR
jgi:high-affinity nickel-transport protein